jgi:hypothetical protein
MPSYLLSSEQLACSFPLLLLQHRELIQHTHDDRIIGARTRAITTPQHAASAVVSTAITDAGVGCIANDSFVSVSVGDDPDADGISSSYRYATSDTLFASRCGMQLSPLLDQLQLELAWCSDGGCRDIQPVVRWGHTPSLLLLPPRENLLLLLLFLLLPPLLLVHFFQLLGDLFGPLMPLPLPHLRQPTTANSQQPTTNSQQPTTNSQQPTANSQQPTPNSQQPTANTKQPTANIKKSRNDR